MWILRRNVEGAPRSNELGHTNIRMLGGVRGEINDEWNYDFYYMHGQNNQYDSYNNDLNITRIGNALDVIEDPDTGEWVCRNDAGNGCVPWNIFTNSGTGMVSTTTAHGVTQEAIDYMSTVAVQYGVTSIEVFNLTFTSDWENYGVALPSASEGVQMAIGAEYREEYFKNTPDEVYRTGERGRLRRRHRADRRCPSTSRKPSSSSSSPSSRTSRAPRTSPSSSATAIPTTRPPAASAPTRSRRATPRPRAGASAAATTAPSARPTSPSSTGRRAST